MKYTTQGNCPWCDAESGISTAWGMSPEGIVRLQKSHDNNHPENQPSEPKRECDCEWYHKSMGHK